MDEFQTGLRGPYDIYLDPAMDQGSKNHLSIPLYSHCFLLCHELSIQQFSELHAPRFMFIHLYHGGTD